ncbi:MAG: hypothetical protein AAF799_34460 [Myxococcota bacterium]
MSRVGLVTVGLSVVLSLACDRGGGDKAEASKDEAAKKDDFIKKADDAKAEAKTDAKDDSGVTPVVLEKSQTLQHRPEPTDAKVEQKTGDAKAPVEPAPPVPPAPQSKPDPKVVTLSAPPFGYTLVREAPVSSTGPQPKLKRTSAKRNAVTDVDAWFASVGLSLPVISSARPGGPPSPSLPETIPDEFLGEAFVTALSDPGGHTISFYGRGKHLAVVRDSKGDSLGAFDFTAFEHSPKDVPADRGFTSQEPVWAQVSDGVLYVCTGHRTYAKSSGGLTAFVTALELPTGELLWQSDPLVCNSRNFLLDDGWLITGYGFTAEPDFIYVLDMKTGKTVSKQKLESGPDVFLRKDDTLYVRTYNRDYEFTVR